MNRAFYDVRYNTTYEDIIDDILYQYVTEWDGAFLLTLREVPGQILIYAYGNKAVVFPLDINGSVIRNCRPAGYLILDRFSPAGDEQARQTVAAAVTDTIVAQL